MAAARSAASSSRSATSTAASRMPFGGGDSLGEPDDQAQPLVNRGRQSRFRSRVQQRLVQQRDRAARFLRLDLTQESERLGTLCACGGAGDEVVCQRARSLDLAGREMRARRLGSAAVGVGSVLRRRQTERVLAQFSRHDRRALDLGGLCRLLERISEVGVRSGRSRAQGDAPGRPDPRPDRRGGGAHAAARPRAVPGRGPRRAADA